MSDTRRLLAFDFGLKRIGIASGNLLTRTASPVTTLTVGSRLPWVEIDTLIGDWQPDLIVVGHPGPGADATLLAALDTFLSTLGERFPRPIEQVDESFSSVAAADELRAGRRKGLYNRRLDKKQIDSGAACLIAEQWMSESLD
jgi:putative Holliday junction resolvase